jgi:SAM-dependent methyltransferase
MTTDIRAEAAGYYDLNPNAPNDVPFYKGKIPSPAAPVLELGCGTGRVLLPLAESCGYMHGIDSSAAMLALCREKLHQAGIPSNRAQVEVGDITNFDLGRRFDLIIAPYRVFQNLETATQVDGLFRCVRKHLSPAGTCILNVFKPNRAPEALRRDWCTEDERLAWEISIEGTRIVCHERSPRMDPDNLVLYPELIYRRYEEEVLTGEAVLKIAMRCYYPEEFEKIIRSHGFRIVARWGGYAGEPYGEGSELVVQFTHGT